MPGFWRNRGASPLVGAPVCPINLSAKTGPVSGQTGTAAERAPYARLHLFHCQGQHNKFDSLGFVPRSQLPALQQAGSCSLRQWRLALLAAFPPLTHPTNVLPSSILTFPAHISSTDSGSIFHSACSITLFCSISGVSPSRTSTALCITIGPPSGISFTI